MKLLSMLTAGAMLFAGCLSSQRVGHVAMKSRVYQRSDTLQVYRFDPAAGSYRARIILGHAGDPIEVSELRLFGPFSYDYRGYFILAGGSDEEAVRGTDVAMPVLDSAERFPLRFKVSSQDSTLAWGRAAEYIVRHSDMKIETSSSYLLQTYTPTSVFCDGCIGAAISRIPGRDSTSFSVRTYSNDDPLGVAAIFAHRLAYYMATGQE